MHRRLAHGDAPVDSLIPALAHRLGTRPPASEPRLDPPGFLIGRGTDVLPTLAGSEPFDLVFVDADKESNPAYLDWAARLGRPGTIVVLDNVVRAGAVADPPPGDTKVAGARAGVVMLGEDPRFDATALQTLDRKGWDGFALAILTEAVASREDARTE